MTEVRTRIEPAPSGSIHVGNARTALYSWLFARQNDGRFVLRIADTDAKRATEENFRAVLKDLRWLGLNWDEGPDAGGPAGPYRQSERFDLYREQGEKLLGSGHAYRCYCTPEELDAARKRAQAEKRPPGYPGTCRNLTPEEIADHEAAGRSSVVRFAVPEAGSISFDDVVRGAVTTRLEQIQDFVILRSDGTPTYQLAVTVDDMLMGITHIIRGEDLMASTPRQLLLREALGETGRPVFAHLPLLVSPDGRPLSKRWGDVSVAAYREQGFLPEALLNYLALLGWSYDDKTNVFSVAELIEKFSLERVGRNPAAFDMAKLEWLNGHYIRRMSAADLTDRLVPFCARAGLPADSPEGREILARVAPLLLERLRRLDEVPPMVRFLFERTPPDEKARKALDGRAEYLT
ncbi:MAG: glutamate--tRNA ligase, partial [Actinobacteria bacterium]|nr:glutamate--tRNA ligase [Actinomycetota bacterium]